MNNYLVTWFYAEKKDDESFYPSVGGNTSSPEFQKVYWRCVYDFYKSASLTQKNKNIHYLFFTNVPNLPTDIDGVNFEEFFKENQIAVVQLELTNKTPEDWYGAWRNQFYLFDVLAYLQNIEGNHLILDSDCFITKDLHAAFEDIEKHKIITYDCGYQDTHSINGISTEQMRLLYAEFYSENVPLRYKGGELIGLSSRTIPEILKVYRQLWKLNYTKYQRHETKLNEEAHFLSMIYARMGYMDSIANQYIKRMWTAIQCDNVENCDAELAIWHLPAEKKYAFESMFLWLRKECSEQEYLNHLRKMLIIPGSRTLRKIKKTAVKIKEKISG